MRPGNRALHIGQKFSLCLKEQNRLYLKYLSRNSFTNNARGSILFYWTPNMLKHMLTLVVIAHELPHSRIVLCSFIPSKYTNIPLRRYMGIQKISVLRSKWFPLLQQNLHWKLLLWSHSSNIWSRNHGLLPWEPRNTAPSVVKSRYNKNSQLISSSVSGNLHIYISCLAYLLSWSQCAAKKSPFFLPSIVRSYSNSAPLLSTSLPSITCGKTHAMHYVDVNLAHEKVP